MYFSINIPMVLSLGQNCLHTFIHSSITRESSMCERMYIPMFTSMLFKVVKTSWKEGLFSGSHSQHCLMSLYTAGGQPSGGGIR